MKKSLRILTVVLLVAPAALARVLSYAPYSEKYASRVQQSRTARHVLVNEVGGAVLYDTTGAEEPRVFEKSCSAMYEDQNALVLFCGSQLSRDGGLTWIQTPTAGNEPWPADTGGPFARGIAGPVQLGTAQFPFVTVSMSGDVVAVSIDGTIRTLASSPAKLIGRNRAGTRYLVSKDGAVSIVDFEGRIAPVATDLSPEYGWITGDGSVFTVTRNANGPLRLRFHEHQQESFKTGRGAFFAVPTADFEGAWMVQQDQGQPTTLSAYFPGQGEAEMWTDPAGPHIEALIPGATGNTLLIQTTRSRVPRHPFAGVGLAVWHMGHPAPAEYDELLARLGPGYGFAHVDPDALESGAPFVFDTAYDGDQVNGGGALPRRSTGSGGADVVQEWGLVHGTFTQRLVLPAVSRTPGAHGSFWKSDVVLYNPLNAAQDVTVRFAGDETRLTVGAHEIQVLPDVVATLFHRERGGGPMFFEPKQWMTITSRTYTPSGNGAMGYSMDAVDQSSGATARYPYSFAGALPAGDYRTNVLLTDLSGNGSEATLRSAQRSEPVHVPANATLQLGYLDQLLGVRGGLFLSPLYGRLLTTVVAIDNRTNDATYFPPDPSMLGLISRVFPGLAHIDYPDGSKLRSDVYVFNPAPYAQEIGFEAKATETDQWPRMKWFRIEANQTRVFTDIVSSDFYFADSRIRLRYWPAEWVPGAPLLRVTARTYFVDANGGTRGTAMPSLNNFQFAAAGETLELVAQTGTNLRFSLGLAEMTINPSGDPSVVRIHVFDDKGKELDSFEEVIRASHGAYFDDIFRARNLTPPPAARIVVEVVSTPTLIVAYGLLTDAATKDLSYVSANHGN